MEIYLIQVPIADWSTYIKVCQDNLEYSPTRGIDDAGIDIKSPSAFLYTLDLANQPRRAIHRKDYYGHSFVSFLGVLDSDITMDIARKLRGIAVTSKLGRRKDIAIFSADLAVWDYAITSYTTSESGKYIRDFLNRVKRCLERAGYNEIWSGYDEIPQADGTFTLRNK